MGSTDGRRRARRMGSSPISVLGVLSVLVLCASLLTGCGASREPNGLETKVTDLNAQLAKLTQDKQKAEADLKAAQDALQKAQASSARPGSTAALVSTSVPAQTSGTVLFFDNFDSGLSSSWSLASGNWETQAGDLHLRNGGTGYAYVRGGEAWTNYTVEADMRLPTQYWMELVVRATDDLNKVVLGIDQNNMVFVTYVDGRPTDVESTRVFPGGPAECHVLVSAVGGEFKCYVNGTLRTHLEDSRFPVGTAGVAVHGAGGGASTSFRFDNFKVTAMP